MEHIRDGEKLTGETNLKIGSWNIRVGNSRKDETEITKLKVNQKNKIKKNS